MVFIKRQEAKQPGFPVGVVLNKNTKGDIGIEVEVEGVYLPTQVPIPWVAHHDGSLRVPKLPGGAALEYVLERPIDFDAVDKEVKNLYAYLTKDKSKIIESNRTSVHIHLNVQKFHFSRLTAFMAIYFTLEELLTEWCGDHRVGNLFCLRAKDAPAIVTQIRRFIKSEGVTEIRDHHHYAALNANALHKFGSLEIRTLRGVSDPRIILDWVAMLRRIYDMSAEFKDPRDICAVFSQDGPLNFLDTMLGDTAKILKSGVSYDQERIVNSLYDGIRMAQDLCYCRDWSVVNPVKVSPDPFGRDLRKMMKRFGGLAASPTGTLLPPVHDGVPTMDEIEAMLEGPDEEFTHEEPFHLPPLAQMPPAVNAAIHHADVAAMAAFMAANNPAPQVAQGVWGAVPPQGAVGNEGEQF